MWSDEPKLSLDVGSDKSSFLCLRRFFFVLRYFFLMTGLKMMSLGPSHMVRALLHSPIDNLLVVSVAQFLKMVKYSFPFLLGEIVNYSFPIPDGEILNCYSLFYDG